MLVSVNDTSNLAPVTDAFFSHQYYNRGNGNYVVYVPANSDYWCDSPRYRVEYTNSDGYTNMQISLTKDVWP